MARVLVTLEIDNIQLFDMLHNMNNNYEPFSTRIAGLFMTADPSFWDAAGLEMYGISIIEAKILDEDKKTTG